MNLKILTLVTFLISTQLVYAEKHLMFLGGGGEPEGDNTIFDQGMNDFGKNLKKAKWKYEISFNGGHRKTEEILKNKFSRGQKLPTEFSLENYTKMIEDYKNKIVNGEIRSGDQLMIIISSHGFKKDDQELTHKVSLSGRVIDNYDTAVATESVSLDKLQEIVKLTNERGINLGIIDLSCHSGNTLALKKNSTNTCIISSSGPLHYGFYGLDSFNDAFLSNLKSGVSLEEAFLKSRLSSKETSYPMISTNENDQIVKEVYDGITPYLYFYKYKTDKLTPYILGNANPSKLCKREDDFNKLISKIDALKLVLNSNKNTFNADNLKFLLKEYKKSQDNVFDAIKKMGAFNLEKVEIFSIPPNENNLLSEFTTKYTWSELLFLDVDTNISNYEKKLRNSKSIPEKKDSQSMILLLKQVKLKKQQILTENPKLMDYQNHTRKMIKDMKNTESITMQIALQEKQLYEELYRRNQNSNPNDPCKKIIF